MYSNFQESNQELQHQLGLELNSQACKNCKVSDAPLSFKYLGLGEKSEIKYIHQWLCWTY